MSLAVRLERAVGPLDALRLLVFRLVLRSRALAALLVRRERRLALQLTLHASVAFVLAIYFPALLFVLGPVLLGVLHVAADVRYLVLARRLSRSWLLTIVGACLLLFGLHGLELLRAIAPSTRRDLALVTLWAVAAVVAGGRESKADDRVGVGLLLALTLGALAWLWPQTFRLLFLHGHNLVALAVWPLFFRRRPKLVGLLVALIVGAAALLASGAFFRASLASSGVRAFGLHALGIATQLSPVDRADYALGLTSAFVFLQAIHYAVWLSVIPQGSLPGQGTLTFRRSVSGVTREFGLLGSALVVLAAVAVVVAACFNAPRAAATYLSLAMFHGYLELVLVLYFWVAKTPLGVTSEPWHTSPP
jgi:hypothetical protein